MTEEKLEKELARMDTPKVISDDSRTASTAGVLSTTVSPASSLPWHIRADVGLDGDDVIESANDAYVTDVFGGDPDGRYIVHAANLYPELLAALKAHDAYMTAQFEGPDSDALHPKAAANWRNVRAVVAKAEGR